MKSIIESINSLFEIDNETTATILITLFVFISGVLINELVRVIKHVRDKQVIRRIVANYITNLSNDLTKQVKIYNELVEELEIKNFEKVTFRKKIIDFSQFNYISHDKLHDAYLTGLNSIVSFRRLKAFRAKVLHKLIVTVKASEIWYNESYKSQDKIVDQYNYYNNLRHIALEDFRKLSDHMILDFGSMLGQTADFELIGLISQKKNELIEVPNYTRPDIINEQLVTPLIAYIKTSKRRDNLPLLNLLLDAEYNYMNMLNVLVRYREQFENYSKITAYNIKLLRVALSYLK